MFAQPFNVTAANDGVAYYDDPNWNPPGPTTGTFGSAMGLTQIWQQKQWNAGPSYRLMVALLKWDTSTLPAAAVVTGATLTVTSAGVFNSDTRNLTMDWFVHGGGITSDYTSTPGTNAIAVEPLSSLPADGQQKIFQLNNAAANVNKSGYTGIRMHVDGGQPGALNNNNAFTIYSADQTTYAVPTLTVIYTIWQTSYTRPTEVGKKKRTQALPI